MRDTEGLCNIHVWDFVSNHITEPVEMFRSMWTNSANDVGNQMSLQVLRGINQWSVQVQQAMHELTPTR